jgi:hypothetical protein
VVALSSSNDSPAVLPVGLPGLCAGAGPVMTVQLVPHCYDDRQLVNVTAGARRIAVDRVLSLNA